MSCKTKHCPFYGNPGTRGYCSSCYVVEYPKVKAAREAAKAQRIAIEQPATWSLNLPPELWTKIVIGDDEGDSMDLDLEDVGRLQLVCRDLYHLSNSFNVWRAVWKSYADETYDEILDNIYDDLDLEEDEEEEEEEANNSKDMKKEEARKRNEREQNRHRVAETNLRNEKRCDWLKRKFLKFMTVTCCGCRSFTILTSPNEIDDMAQCDECQGRICEGGCGENCHYCGAALCSTCGTFCASCGEAQHCHEDEWINCECGKASICPACDNSDSRRCDQCDSKKKNRKKNRKKKKAASKSRDDEEEEEEGEKVVNKKRSPQKAEAENKEEGGSEDEEEEDAAAAEDDEEMPDGKKRKRNSKKKPAPVKKNKKRKVQEAKEEGKQEEHASAN